MQTRLGINVDQGDFAILRQDITTQHGHCMAGTRVKIVCIGSVDSLVDDGGERVEEGDSARDHYAIVEPENNNQAQIEVLLSDLIPVK